MFSLCVYPIVYKHVYMFSCVSAHLCACTDIGIPVYVQMEALVDLRCLLELLGRYHNDQLE